MQRLEYADRYGTRAEGVALFMSMGSDRPLRVARGTPARNSIRASQEIIVHLDDLVLRRSIMVIGPV